MSTQIEQPKSLMQQQLDELLKVGVGGKFKDGDGCVKDDDMWGA